MKIILFSGSHPRHLFIHRAIIDSGMDYRVVVMHREELIPAPPAGLDPRDRDNFIRHFADRARVEERYYGTFRPEQVYDPARARFIQPEALNTEATAAYVRDFAPDACFIFGTRIITDPVLQALPPIRLNLHLGLSPWYKGGATLFWPFYFMKPQFAGATLHQIVLSPDAGDVLHQSVPELERGDSIHDVGAKTVLKARNDVALLASKLAARETLPFRRQNTTGRVFRSVDFHAAYLRVIYDLFDNRMVDAHLDGVLGSDQPKLIQAW